MHSKQQQPSKDLECGVARQRANTNEKLSTSKTGGPKLEADFWPGQGEQDQSNGAKSNDDLGSAPSDQERIASLMQMLKKAFDLPLIKAPPVTENHELSLNPASNLQTVLIEFTEDQTNGCVITNPKAVLNVLEPQVFLHSGLSESGQC